MSKLVLSINAGSSSLKFKLFSMPEEICIFTGQFDGVNAEETLFKATLLGQKIVDALGLCDFERAIDYLLDYLVDQEVIDKIDNLELIGHRIAHGGETFPNSININKEVLGQLDKLCRLAPLHNPINLFCIRQFMDKLPNAKHVAVFDTAFHQSIQPELYLYALPYRLYTEHGIRRFGFHGISHQYISETVSDKIESNSNQRIISCHLGNGSSICAINNGESMMTSMGYTPLAGLMMGTRCGDIDPALPKIIAEAANIEMNQVENMMNQESGLLGISELSNDFRKLQIAKDQGNEQATLALSIFTNRVTQTIGAYAALMEGVDAIVFTGGIGENSVRCREDVCQGLGFMGVNFEQERNAKGFEKISHSDSKVQVFVINTDEELMISREVIKLTTA